MANKGTGQHTLSKYARCPQLGFCQPVVAGPIRSRRLHVTTCFVQYGEHQTNLKLYTPTLHIPAARNLSWLCAKPLPKLYRLMARPVLLKCSGRWTTSQPRSERETGVSNSSDGRPNGSRTCTRPRRPLHFPRRYLPS